MLKVEEKNNVESAFLLIKFLNKHINNCHKLICNCKLFENYRRKQLDIKYNKEELKYYISGFINILNYLIIYWKVL